MFGSGDNQGFPGRKLRRRSRKFTRVFSLVFTGFSLVFGLVAGWFVYDQGTWSEADAVIVSRNMGPKIVDLGVEFHTPGGDAAATIVREWNTVHAVGETVRIRYALSGTADVRNARLAEEPIVQPVFFVTAGLFFVIGLGLVYYAWWRMPPDSTR